MQAGLKTPHTVLNAFVKVMTNFRPSDHEDDGTLNIALPRPGVFDLSKLYKSTRITLGFGLSP